MNIFVVDENPLVAAKALCDKHIVKMPLETAQILSTVSYLRGFSAPYKPTHQRHPCVLWANQTLANWNWLVEHGIALCQEYSQRYKKTHKSLEVIQWCKNQGGKPNSGILTPFVLAMSEEYHRATPVDSYQAYYHSKAKFAKWNYTSKPAFWKL